MDAKTFFGELKRRNVYKVATAYAVVAWLLIQCALTFRLPPRVEAPAWLLPGFIILLVLGFIFILYISWAFEATPTGLKRTAEVPDDANLPSWSPRKFAIFVGVMAALAAGMLVFDVIRSRNEAAPAPTTAAP